MLSKSILNVWIKRYSKISGVPRINGKGLKHSNVSYLIAEIGSDCLQVRT